MPKVLSIEKLFKQARNSSIYSERWTKSQNKHDLLITKWAKHIEETTKKKTCLKV